MQTYKLVASDLDGTLLNSAMEISAENTAAIQKMRARGVYFVPASGRTLGEMDPKVRDHPDLRYLIYSDGAGILDKETGQKENAFMDRTLCDQILDILDEYEVFFLTHYDGISYVDADRLDKETLLYHQIDPYYAELVGESNQPIGNFRKFCREIEECELFFIFFHSDGKMQECRARIEQLEGVQTASSALHSFEIVSDKAGKGGALLRLAKMLGVDPAATIAVGDSSNDSSMILAAGLGLAMENARPELKAIADEEICNNDQHAAKYILEHYIK